MSARISSAGRLFDAREIINDDLDKYLDSLALTALTATGVLILHRFITICENGHMSDFPWRWWVHRGDIRLSKGK
jgi:hypothetical protein